MVVRWKAPYSSFANRMFNMMYPLTKVGAGLCQPEAPKGTMFAGGGAHRMQYTRFFYTECGTVGPSGWHGACPYIGGFGTCER